MWHVWHMAYGVLVIHNGSHTNIYSTNYQRFILRKTSCVTRRRIGEVLVLLPVVVQKNPLATVKRKRCVVMQDDEDDLDRGISL
jgi:hypothetical protein